MPGSDPTFRPLTRDDFPRLATWLAAPHVARWWSEPSDPASLEATYGPSVDQAEPGQCFVVEQDGRPVGLVQRYRLTDYPAWERSLEPARLPPGSAGIDYLIGPPELIGVGLGPPVIERFVAQLWTDFAEVPAVVASVAQDNRRSWRALEKAGFERHWSGDVVSDDPSDAGPSYVYVRRRPGPDGIGVPSGGPVDSG